MTGIHERLANVETHESTCPGLETVNLARRSAKLMITNDSATTDLRVTLQGTEHITLKPTETITLPFRTQTIDLLGANVPYRIWSFS